MQENVQPTELWFLELMKQKCKKKFFNSLLLPQVLVIASLSWAAALKTSKHPQMCTPPQEPGGTTSERSPLAAPEAKPQLSELQLHSDPLVFSLFGGRGWEPTDCFWYQGWGLSRVPF